MQTTIKNVFKIDGIGLHSGKNFEVRVSPAPANTGIRFKRSDVINCEFTKITPYNVTSTQLATTINCGELPISTIEHLMGSFYGMEVDNAFVEVSGPEIPILDGSAKLIVENILKAKIIKLNTPKKILKVTRPISISTNDKFVEIHPSNNFEIKFTLDYPHPLVGKQVYNYISSPESFIKEIAFARTFGFKKEVDTLWSMGLAKGGSLNNAIVIGNDNILNPEGLHTPDELVRHKILDMLGDLSLIGYRLQGSIITSKSGHHLNNIFAKALIEATNSYKIIDEPESNNNLNYNIKEPITA